jgi:hypothetical protein
MRDRLLGGQSGPAAGGGAEWGLGGEDQQAATDRIVSEVDRDAIGAYFGGEQG